MKQIKYKFNIPLSFNCLPHQQYIRYTRNGSYKDPKLKHHQYHIGIVAKSAMIKNKWKLIEGDFKLNITFYCKDRRRGDATNMLKTVEDALQKICYSNDKNRIDGWQKIKYDKLNPRLEIEVIPLYN